MTAPGAAHAAQYTYPALGGLEAEGQEPPPQPSAYAAPPSRPAPDHESLAAADAIVRAALNHQNSIGARALAGSLVGPGAIPLRPLSLSEIYNGAVAVLRSNPKAVLGFSVVVLGIGALLQVAVLAPALRWALRVAGVFGGAVAPDSPANKSTISIAAVLADAPITVIASVLIVGCVMPVLARALAPAGGQQGSLSAGSAWRETRGAALPLTGLAFAVLGAQTLIALLPVFAALLLVAVGFPTPGVVLLLVLGEPVFLLIAYALGVFLSLAAPALMSERLGVLAACRRSVRLVWRGFGKVLGIGLLTSLVTAFVGLSLSLPFTVAGEVFAPAEETGGHASLLGVVLLTLGQLVSRSILMPFTASVTALLYVDQRMRQEAYDLVLLGQTGSGSAAAFKDDENSNDDTSRQGA